MDEYLLKLREYLLNSHDYRISNFLYDHTLNGWIKVFLGANSLIELSSEIKDIIGYDFNLLIDFGNFITRMNELELIIDPRDNALTLIKYKSEYPNISNNGIGLIYKAYSRQIKFGYVKLMPKYYLQFINHEIDCNLNTLGVCICKFSQDMKNEGLKNALRMTNNSRIHPIWEIWELEPEWVEYTDYIQWVPRELIELNLEYYSGPFVVDPNTYRYS